MRALALWSGGLDSTMAIKLIQNQGIEVIALNFVSYFFGGSNPKIEKLAEEIGVEVKFIDFREEHRKMVKNPKNGYGSNMNPCIDCHALMLEVAGRLLDKYNANFVITGETLGQRPMSQNYQALQQVEKLSTISGLVVRPMSAKRLEITIPEEKGWIDREKLMDIEGRSRKRQMALAEKLGVKNYPSPGGGCSLTEPNFSKRLKILKDDDFFENGNMFYMIKLGRFYRFDKGKYLIVGREESENKKLWEYREDSSLYIDGDKTPGPLILGIGNLCKEEIGFAKRLFARYSKTKGEEISYIDYNGDKEEVAPFKKGEIKKKIEEYQIL